MYYFIHMLSKPYEVGGITLFYDEETSSEMGNVTKQGHAASMWQIQDWLRHI